MPLIVDVRATDYHDQLYQRYATLREEHPVYFDASRNIWMITRYEDVRHLLRHPDGTLNGSTGTAIFLPWRPPTAICTKRSAVT